jgi:bacteriorhodopsin
MKLTMYSSLLLSIVTQVVTGVIDITALFMKVPSSFFLIKQLLALELVVQVIEGSFYVYWFKNFKTITNITPKRYLDWAITTPTMLITLIFYLMFLNNRDKNKEKDIDNINNNNNNKSNQLDFFDLFNKEFYTIVIVLVLNWLMLLFGYLAEINLIPVMLGVSLGFIPFLIYYYIIYKKYALLSEDGLKIFFYFFIIWSVYGIAATLPYKIKNMFYNILDLFAKNFLGLFLSYLVFSNVR